MCSTILNVSVALFIYLFKKNMNVSLFCRLRVDLLTPSFVDTTSR
jgi:hypothetical protein